MENVTLRDVSTVLEGDAARVPGIPVAGVSIDSRTVATGEVFFAIRGERFDGHDFVGQALDNGAVAAVVSREAAEPSGTHGDERAARASDAGSVLLRVGDTVEALQKLAAWYRGRLDLKVVAVTGTNGKTTTKDMTAAVLSAAMPTARTEGNLNNHIGVPLTLLDFTSRQRAAVVEMGMNHPGEIARLARIARPEVGVITNVAEGHLESMETLEAVAEAKGELLEALPAEGAAVLNADDARVMSQASRTKADVTTFGLGPTADIRATGVREVIGGGPTPGVEFQIAGDGAVRLPVPGRHNVANALAALAVGDVLGVDREAATAALESFRSSPMRMDVTKVGRLTVLNDAYNSNPGSLTAALETLVSVAAGRPALAALGDMLELGARSAAAHREAGAAAAWLGLARLLLYGEEVAHLRDGAIAGGMPPDDVTIFDDKDALARELEGLAERDVVLLVKGSRGMRMEEVVELLVREAPAS